jgi:hypothetical protein
LLDAVPEKGEQWNALNAGLLKYCFLIVKNITGEIF